MPIILFTLGSIILTVTTTILSYWIPKQTAVVEFCNTNNHEMQSVILDRQTKFREFRLLDKEHAFAAHEESLSTRKGSSNAELWNDFFEKAKVLKIDAMTHLIESVGENVNDDELIKKYGKDALSRDGKDIDRFVATYKVEINRLISEKKRLEMAAQQETKLLSRVSFWTAFFQLAALLLIGASEVLSKLESK